MRKSLTALAASAMLLGVSAPLAVAHHSQAMYTDASGAIQISGVVKKFEFTNPHAFIYLEVKGEDGTTKLWACEMQSIRALKLNGWLATSVKPGDKLTIIGRPARNGNPAMYAEVTQFPDGHSLRS